MRHRNWLIRDILIGIGVSIALLTSGCSHLTVSPKLVQPNTIAFDENVQNAGVIDCDARGCLVTKNWMAKYAALEREFKVTISADSNIKSEGDNYRVSFEVVNHFIGMRAAQRGP